MTTWTPLVAIGAFAGAVYGLHLIWQHAAKPIWKITVAFVNFSEALPVLLEIAEEFKPNDGHSLRDQVDYLIEGQRNMQQQLENVITDLQ